MGSRRKYVAKQYKRWVRPGRATQEILRCEVCAGTIHKGPPLRPDTRAQLTAVHEATGCGAWCHWCGVDSGDWYCSHRCRGLDERRAARRTKPPRECPTPDKLVIPDRGLAIRLQRETGAGSWYECRCRAWHLSSRPPGDPPWRRRSAARDGGVVFTQLDHSLTDDEDHQDEGAGDPGGVADRHGRPDGGGPA